MNDHTGYVTAAYGVLFVVLAWDPGVTRLHIRREPGTARMRLARAATHMPSTELRG